MSVPVCPFSPLVSVHLVSLLQLEFQVELADYPDQASVANILNGLQDSFPIGVEASSVSMPSGSSNMHSVFNHPSVIDAHLKNEVLCDQVAGPFSSPSFTDLHISCFGVVPKSKWENGT